jgi:type I restriction enzyme, R subunit
MNGNWNEAKTRKELIDKLLKKDNWGPIVPFEEGKKYFQGAVEEFPTTSGPADYALFNKGRIIAVVEGKKVAVGPQNVLQQAERYARESIISRLSIPRTGSTSGLRTCVIL